MAASSSTRNETPLSEAEVQHFFTLFQSSSDPAQLFNCYKALNEGNQFLERCGVSSQEFIDMNDDQYQTLVKQLKLFELSPDTKRMAVNLMSWCQMVGCLLLPLSRSRHFFFTGLQLLQPDIVDKMRSGIPDDQLSSRF